MKKIVRVRGFLGRTAVVGDRVSICCDDGSHYLTSPVVGVRNDSATGIEVETMKTMYKIICSEGYNLTVAV